MKRKLLPPFLMLFAGAVTGIIMIVLRYETKAMLGILLGVLIGFYIMGCLINWMLGAFERQNAERKAAEESMEEAERETAEKE